MADEALTPVIVQDAATNRVLMLAYANEEALRRTRETGEAWFWSRSRDELWHKGATSGNTMAVEEIRGRLRRRRPALPRAAERARRATPAPSRASPRGCGAIVAERAATRPEGSYVVGLLDGGTAAAAREGGGGGGRGRARRASPSRDERLVEELADLWFHSYVLLAARGLQPSAVEDELRRRHTGA